MVGRALAHGGFVVAQLVRQVLREPTMRNSLTFLSRPILDLLQAFPVSDASQFPSGAYCPHFLAGVALKRHGKGASDQLLTPGCQKFVAERRRNSPPLHE